MENFIKSCVVTDLDDTVWDWLNMWYNSFNPYFEEIKTKFNLDDAALKADFKKLHQKYNTTEVSFAYGELTTLSDDNKNAINKKPSALEKSIYHKYNSNKKSNLQLYEGVLETLNSLKSQGVLIIGFTESNAFFTKYRLKHLGLDGLFDCIYTPLDTGVPKSAHKVYDENYWEPKKTEIRYLSKSMKKPDSEILGIILRDFKVKKENAIYIGDKIDRDIRMANDAGVTSVFASYGSIIDGGKYKLLTEVTHWSDEDVIREQEYKDKHKNDQIRPDFTLVKSYSEIFNFFQFTSYEKLDKDMIPNIITIWSQIVTVQQHFNDIGLKIRNLTLTAFTFIIAALGYVVKEDIVFYLGKIEIKAITIFSFLGAIIMSIFFFMDKYWYHKFLLGSVSQATKIENRWGKLIPELGLSNAISNKSRFQVLWRFTFDSKRRFNFFYPPLIVSFIFLFIASFWLTDNNAENNTKLNYNSKAFEKLYIENSKLTDQNKKAERKNDSLTREILNAEHYINILENDTKKK